MAVSPPAAGMERRALLAALGAAGATGLLAGCTDRTGSGSPTPNGTEPPSESPTDPPGSPSPSEGSAGEPSGAAVRWTHELGGPVNHAPMLADGTLYVAGGANAQGTPPRDNPVGPDTSQNLLALSTAGEERWRYESDAAMQSRPVLADGAVHVVTGWSNGYSGVGARLLRVESDGSFAWSNGPRSRFLSILGHAEGTVFVGTSDDAIGATGESLFAVGPDGTTEWTVESGDAFDGTVHDGTLYVDNGGMRLLAIAPSDGSTRWSSDLGLPGPLAVYGDTIYLDATSENENDDYPLVAVDAATGEERWRYGVDMPDRFVVSGALEAAGSTFVTEYDGLLAALDPADGSERWRYDADARTGEFRVHDGTLYLPAGGDLHAVDAATGEGQWTRSVGSHVWRAYPSDAGVVVRARSGGDRDLFAGFDPDGTERWTFESAGGLTLPAVDGLRAYVGTESGYVAALGSETDG